MNQVIRDAGSGSNTAWLLGVATLLFIAVFFAFVVRVFRRAAKPSLDQAAHLPLEDDDASDSVRLGG